MKVAFYVRVSSQRQMQTQTIEQQLERLREYCQNQGWTCPDEHIFRDDGFSGSKLKRPGLDRLRDQLRQASFERVLITVPDRLARNYVHQMLLMEEIEKAGCSVEFIDRPMSKDPHDQLLLQIRGAVAEYERTLITERMRRGRQQKYRAGSLLPWSRIPYGYSSNPDRPRDPQGIRFNEAEAATIVEIFNYYLGEGHNLTNLAKHLMKLEIPTPNGRSRWSIMSLRGMLTNPVYTGMVYAGRERTVPTRQRNSPLKPIGRKNSSQPTNPDDWILVGQIPALISKEQFELVAAKLGRNQQFARRNNKTHEYLLRALVSCGKCQASCIGRSSGENTYYFCRTKLGAVYSARDEKCISRLIPADQLDEVVWQDLCEVVQHPIQISQALQRAQNGEWLPQELQARRENLRKSMASMKGQLERLTEAYLAQVLTLEEYKRRRQDLEQRINGLENQVRQLEISAKEHIELSGLVTSIEDFCKRVASGLNEATFEQKRQLVELLIDRVVVNNEEVEIRYVIPTSPKGETTKFCHLLTDYFFSAMLT